MGETNVPLFQPTFNRSVRVEASAQALTEDAGALLLRQAWEQLGLDGRLGALPDARDPDRVTYSMRELVRTRVLLLAQGWGDQGDANLLRYDAAFRLSTSDRAGESPLADDAHLPSQPTLSRLGHGLAGQNGTTALNGVLLDTSLFRIKAAEPGRKRMAIDIDTMPKEVHGKQDGASYNTHYGVVCFQPLIALAETGDLLAVRLRPGGNPSAAEAFGFLAPVLDAAKANGLDICVRMDCGFANAHIMRELDARRVRFITRLRNTPALHQQTEAWFQQTLAAWRAAPSQDQRSATRELWERAQKGERVRRIIAVVVEPQPGEMFGNRFYLCTNLARGEGGSRALLAYYRQRGTAEGHIGEYVREALPALRAVPRGSSPGGVTIRDNNVTVVLAALAYQLLHHLRRGVELVTAQGWSLGRVRERVLKAAATVVRHGRQTLFRICATKASLWKALAGAICPSAQLAMGVPS